MEYIKKELTIADLIARLDAMDLSERNNKECWPGSSKSGVFYYPSWFALWHEKVRLLYEKMEYLRDIFYNDISSDLMSALDNLIMPDRPLFF